MMIMILKMSAMTAIYVLLTWLLWKWQKNKELAPGRKILVGLIFGAASIASTHFGVDYSHMLLNVRDLGPLSAGMFFDPISGILAGLIGGIERYIAGTYWGIGSYTAVACSVSTCLAGFLAAFVHLFILKRKKTSPVYGFFIGAVMEVFHMYAVFITHRDDMNMAFYVVKNCSIPMIVFTGLGVAVSAIILQVCSGEWRNPFRKRKKEEISVSAKFQVRLFIVSVMIVLTTFMLSFLVQTRSAMENAQSILVNAAVQIQTAYSRVDTMAENVDTLSVEIALRQALATTKWVLAKDGPETVDDEELEDMRTIFDAAAITIINDEGKVLSSAGSSPVYLSLLSEILDGTTDATSTVVSDLRAAAIARCGDGLVQVVVSRGDLMKQLDISKLNEVLSGYHIGLTGTYDIIRNTGYVPIGEHSITILVEEDRKQFQSWEDGAFFESSIFDVNALCLVEKLSDVDTLLVRLPIEEVYANRDIQVYETALADILLFAVIYVLVSMLVQIIVINNLQLVNDSLKKITDGDLDEVVDVRNSSEFVSLSNDINQTVAVLKGYITAAEKRIEQELELARTIQESSLPSHFTFTRNDFELYANMDPAREVGGDFYDFFFAGHDRLALVIADVSGKGIPAALFMMRSKTAIRSLAEAGNSPAEVLYKANNTLCEGNDAEMFVTVWIGIIDLKSGRMTCANAGHEYPAIMRAGGEYELYKDSHGLVLAAMEDARFKEYELQFQPGDRLFVYTDGIPEAINEHTEQYGTDRLIMTLNTLRQESEETLQKELRQDITRFVGAADQFDDITMLGFTYNGPNA